MSLNDGITQKQRGRAELEALVAASDWVLKARERLGGHVRPDGLFAQPVGTCHHASSCGAS